MVVKELKDMQQHIRDMLPTNPEIEEWMSQYRGFGRWIKEMKDLSEYIQELVDSGNAISKEGVAGIKQRFRLHNYPNKWCDLDENMDELKAMQLHIQEKLTGDAEEYQIGRGETMQKWLDDIRDFSRKIKAIIEYADHLEQKHVPFRPNALKDSLKKIELDFSCVVIRQEAMTCYGVSWDHYYRTSREVIDIMKDDIESMSMWVDFILTSTVSQGITQQVKKQLEKLKTDIKDELKPRLRSILDDPFNRWTNLRWRFYKIRQIESLHPVTRHVNWNLFPFTKRETMEIVKQVKAIEVRIKDKLVDAEKWMCREGQQKDDTLMFFQQALHLNHDEPQSTDILAISKLQVELDMLQQQFFQTSIWVDACIQAIGEAKLSSSHRREAYYVIKEDTEIMSWQIHVIMLVVQQEGWEKTAGWLHELKEDLDQLLKSSSHFRKFEPALIFSAIIGWGLLKWKVQMTDKQIKSLLPLAGTLFDCSKQEMDVIIKELEDKQEWIKEALYDAGGEEIQSKTHKKWLSELRDLSYQAEDLIGLYEYQQVANKVKPTSPLEQLSIFCQQRNILHEITDGKKKFEKKYEEVAKNKTDMHVTTVSLPSGDSDNHKYTHEPTGYLPWDSTKFVGREKKMKELKEALLSVHY